MAANDIGLSLMTLWPTALPDGYRRRILTSSRRTTGTNCQSQRAIQYLRGWSRWRWAQTTPCWSSHVPSFYDDLATCLPDEIRRWSIACSRLSLLDLVQWKAIRVNGGEETPGFDLNQWEARLLRLRRCMSAPMTIPPHHLSDWAIQSAPGARFHMRPPGFHRPAVPMCPISLIMQYLDFPAKYVAVELVPR